MNIRFLKSIVSFARFFIFCFSLAFVFFPAFANAQSLARDPMELILNEYFQNHPDSGPLSAQIIDFCQKAPLDEAFKVFSRINSWSQYKNNETNQKALLEVIVKRSDLDCQPLLDCFSNYPQWSQIQEDFFKLLNESGKSGCIPQNPVASFGVHPINLMEYRLTQKVNQPFWGSGHMETNPPTPYPLDPIYLKNPEMMNEGLVRNYLREKDTVSEAAILDQLDFQELTGLQPYLLSGLIEKIGQTNSKSFVLGFLTKLTTVEYWNQPEIAGAIIKLPFDDDPQVRKDKVEILMALEEMAGMGYIQESWGGLSPKDRVDVLMVGTGNRYIVGAEVEIFKDALLKFLLSALPTEKVPSVRAAIVHTLARCFQDQPETVSVLISFYARRKKRGSKPRVPDTACTRHRVCPAPRGPGTACTRHRVYPAPRVPDRVYPTRVYPTACIRPALSELRRCIILR